MVVNRAPFPSIGRKRTVASGWDRDFRFAQGIMAKFKTMPNGSGRYRIHDILLARLLATHLELIVGSKNMNTYGHRYLSFLNQRRYVRPSQVIIMGRQRGKTNCVAMMGCCVLVCGKGKVGISYSLTRDQSRNVLERVRSFLYGLTAGSDYDEIVVDNADRIDVRTLDGCTNSLRARSQKVESNRGDAFNFAFFDEFGFFDQKMWENFALPTLQVGKRVITCITTPGAPESPITDFIREATESRNPNNIFEVVNYSMVCADCRAAGIAGDCRHHMDYIPPWQKYERFVALSEFMSSEKFLTEIMGEDSGSQNRCFNSAQVERCFDARTLFVSSPHEIMPSQDNTIFVCVDPTQGGDSRFAMVSYLWNRYGQLVILGLEAVLMRFASDIEPKALMLEHAQKVRQIQWPLFEHASFFALVEAQGQNNTAATYSRHIYRVAQPCKMYLQKNGNLGYPVTADTKRHAVANMQPIILDGRLKFYREFVTLGASAWNPSAKEPERKQLVRLLKDEFMRLKQNDAGKITGKEGPGMQDDAVTLVCVSAFYANKVRQTL